MDGSFSTTETMRAAVLAGPGQIRLEEVRLPQPGPGQVRVRLEGCGVCASNLTPWEGPEWMTFPTEPGGLGHEGWGVIHAVGEGVRSFAPGDRVATLSHHSYAEFDLADVEQLVQAADDLGVGRQLARLPRHLGRWVGDAGDLHGAGLDDGLHAVTADPADAEETHAGHGITSAFRKPSGRSRVAFSASSS